MLIRELYSRHMMAQTLANSELVVATRTIIDFPKRSFIHYYCNSTLGNSNP